MEVTLLGVDSTRKAHERTVMRKRYRHRRRPTRNDQLRNPTDLFDPQIRMLNTQFFGNRGDRKSTHGLARLAALGV